MLKQSATLLILHAVLSQPLAAQTGSTTDSGTWAVYDRETTSGMPLVVSAKVNDPQAEALLQSGDATEVNCRAEPAFVGAWGMPQGTDRFYPLEDAFDADPALRLAGALHIASASGDGQRRIFILHPGPLDLAAILQAFPISGYSCAAKAVSDLTEIRRLVTLTPIEWQLHLDQSVILNLAQNGDNGSAVRKTDFWFYGPRSALEGLVAELQRSDLVLDHWQNAPDAVVLTRDMAVTISEFATLSPILLEAAQKHGVDYDGWETMVAAQAPQP